MTPSLSRCGHYVAVVSKESVQVHSLSHTSAPPIFQNLRKVLTNHGRRHDTVPPSDSPITVHQVEWEHVLPGNRSSKYAVSVTCGGINLVVVIEVAGGEPGVIEVDGVGIDRFQWFPAIPTTSHSRSNSGTFPETTTPASSLASTTPGTTPPATGSHRNSTMLAVFSRMNLHMKVYSLLCTQALVTVAKPCSHVIFHPTKPRLWSVVAQTYHPKNSAARRSPSTNPRVSHFYTDGVTCSRLVSLELPSAVGTAAKWEWSQSGKWLSSVDPESRLGGADVRVYNLYGIHQRGHVTSGVTECHVAHPTLVAAARDASEFGCLWGLGSGPWSQECDYIVKYDELFDSGRASAITMQVVDIQSLSQGRPEQVVLSEGIIWSHFRDLDLEIKYSRLARIPPAKFRWKQSMTSGGRHVIASDKNVCIFQRQFGASPKLVPEMCVFGDSKFLDVLVVDGGYVMAYSDHVSVLHTGTPIILATSRYSFSTVRFSIEEDTLAVSLVEDTPGGPLWRRVCRPLSHLTSVPNENVVPQQVANEKARESPLQDTSTEHEVTDTFQNKRKDIYRKVT